MDLLPTLRVIDVSLNRIGEGLRLLEDIARLILNDATLNQQLKTVRHDLLENEWSFNQRLIQARDSEGDIGINIEAGAKQKDLPNIVVANAKRVQESLRTLEELAKLPDTELDEEKFKQARFKIYTIEQSLLSKLLRRDKIKQISGLYVIIDTQALERHNYLEVAKQAISGGARIIQLRDKLLSKKELLAIAEGLNNLCKEKKVLFLVNDYLDIALAVGADGLHLGQEDLPLKVARKLLPLDKIIGCSTRTIEQATAAESDGADYLAVGSMYPTTSKEKAEIVGPDRLRQIKQIVTSPIVAIGGITADNATEIIAAGADAVAAISAVLRTDDVEKAARKIVNSIEVQK